MSNASEMSQPLSVRRYRERQIACSAQLSSAGQQLTVSAKSSGNFLKCCSRHAFIPVTAPLAEYEDIVIAD